jgi:hypothetical protein
MCNGGNMGAFSMMKIFAAGIVISTMALGAFAASAASDPPSNNGPKQQVEQTQEKTQVPAVAAKKQTDSAVKNCADILANKADHTPAELAQCQ